MVKALPADAPEPAPGRGRPRGGWAWPQRWPAASPADEATAGEAGGELVRRLFVPAERWGWEFAPPQPLPDPDDPEPGWQEPRAYESARRVRRARVRELPWSALGVGAASAGGWVLPVVGNPLVSSGLLIAGAAVVLARQVGSRSRVETAKANRDFAYQRHREAVERWRRRRQEHERERQRQAGAEHWFPLRPDVSAARVDVFGGSGDGWASLITTVGSSLLRSGSRVLVVDLSEHHVADGLAAFAGAAGFGVSSVELLRDAPPSMLLQGLTPEDAAEVLADAVATIRPPDEAAEQRVIDAGILARVTGCLDQPLTFARIAAALLVVRGHHGHGGGCPLSPVEIRRLTAQIDLIGTTERAANAVATLGNLVELLSTAEPVAGPAEPTGPAPELTVLATAGPHARRKDFLDRVLFQRILHELRARPPEGGCDVLFVAGADALGLRSLEAMAKQARRAGVRLVLMLEHLRDDVMHLLGGAGNATILMRMGNPVEARAAAEFIGRDHSFKVSQVTRQVGKSFTDGFSDSWSTQSGSSDSSGEHSSRPKSARWYERKAGSTSTSAGATSSRSHSWQYTATCSNTDSESTSTTDARQYEFTVEPTQVQGLPTTAFILVDAGPDGRRVLMGDCNPGITLLPQVASGPRR
ncbi:MAG TPA: hypothetical protein VFM37_15095 [Pseudonocardiaceae bacterium]|nr:hypothetical protein [Pseudonocardiaceae bacterium]